jgi:uncharacterized protein YndB with AHSA1/START domain
MTQKARVRVPLPEVRRALTDAGAMRVWLAEHAEVDLPDRYAFWGRHTPEGLAPDASRRHRPLHVDDRTVRFSWLIDGEHSTVEIALAEDGPDATVIRVSQTNVASWEEAIAEESVRGWLLTFWSLAIANLVDYLEGRELTPKADFGTPEMRAQVLIDAPRDAVFASMIDQEQFSRWFGAKVGIEPRVGGRFAMGGFELDPTPAKIIELEPGRKVMLDWDGMVAGWELADSEGKTRLTFVQSGFDQTQPPYDAWMGWLSGVAELRRYHELPDWHPIWLEVDIPGMPADMLTY